MLAIDLSAFAAAASWSRLPQVVSQQDFEKTASDEGFPGAILPRVRSDGALIWYAAADSARDWRRLRPLLVAYAGPTVTTFAGMPVDLERSDPAEALLAEAGASHVARLETPREGTRLAARALARLLTAVARAPREAPRPSRSTGALLADLDMCLAAGDRAGADCCLAVLQDEWRLDAVNLHFVEVRIAATFREWPRLVSQSWFEDLCRVPMPAFIAQALLEALWHVRLEPHAHDPDDLRRHYDGETRAICLELLAEARDTSGDAAMAIAALEGPHKAANVKEAFAVPDAHGWTDWLTALADDRLRDPADAARKAALERPASAYDSAGDIERLANHLQDLALRDDRRSALRAAAPELVRWLKDDPDFPRSLMKPLYSAALMIFTILDERGAAARDALLEVLDALLSLEPSPDDYRQHLQDASSFISGEAGTSTAYWLIDVADRLLLHPASDGGARLALLSAVLSSLQPIARVLTPAQRAAYRRVAVIADWPPLPDPADNGSSFDATVSLEGKVVAIYTLTESVGTQASSMLSEAFPGVRIDVNSDHVCTPRLRALAREVDLFVLVAGSAKHAATDCIQRHRPPEKRLIYATGRGSTSIVRAVEEALRDSWS